MFYPGVCGLDFHFRHFISNRPARATLGSRRLDNFIFSSVEFRLDVKAKDNRRKSGDELETLKKLKRQNFVFHTANWIID